MISDDFDIGGNLANDKPASQGVLPLPTKKISIKNFKFRGRLNHIPPPNVLHLASSGYIHIKINIL